MSYYKKHERIERLVPENGEKKLFQELLAAELKSSSSDAETHKRNFVVTKLAAKKHSSATLLRRKLKGHLVRELNSI